MLNLCVDVLSLTCYFLGACFLHWQHAMVEWSCILSSFFGTMLVFTSLPQQSQINWTSAIRSFSWRILRGMLFAFFGSFFLSHQVFDVFFHGPVCLFCSLFYIRMQFFVDCDTLITFSWQKISLLFRTLQYLWQYIINGEIPPILLRLK